MLKQKEIVANGGLGIGGVVPSTVRGVGEKVDIHFIDSLYPAAAVVVELLEMDRTTARRDVRTTALPRIGDVTLVLVLRR